MKKNFAKKNNFNVIDIHMSFFTCHLTPTPVSLLHRLLYMYRLWSIWFPAKSMASHLTFLHIQIVHLSSAKITYEALIPCQVYPTCKTSWHWEWFLIECWLLWHISERALMILLHAAYWSAYNTKLGIVNKLATPITQFLDQQLIFICHSRMTIIYVLLCYSEMRTILV